MTTFTLFINLLFLSAIILFLVSFTHNSTSFSSSASINTISPISIQTPNSTTEITRKQVLSKAQCMVKELEQQLKQITTVENFLKMCEQNLSPSLYFLVENNIVNKDGSKCEKRYSNHQVKLFALAVYFLSPVAFHFLQKSFSFPAICTLRRVTSQYDFKPGLNEFLFHFLEFKMSSFHPDALNCFLHANEILIKPNLFYNVTKDEIIGFNQSNSFSTYEPAKYALVFMIRGIKYNWQQPIAYFLFSNSCSVPDLNFIIFSTIRRLRSINLNVKSFITDQGSNFIRFSNANNVSPKEPFFEVDGQKVIYMFDPSHLIKSTRNMFFKHLFKINEELVDKKHLDNFYNRVSKKCSLHKLTYFHIYPGPYDKTKVQLAAQVFSATVAAGMSAALNCGLLPIDSERTIHFINDMDKLFDIFNSRKISNGKIFNNPFNNASPQLDHLIKMTEMFTNLTVINKKNNTDVTKLTNFINGWLVSIAGLQMLWKSLNPTQSNPYNISTSCLNQDCVENLLRIFRKQHGNKTNPTPIQFIQSFKKLFCLQYFKHSPGANCLEDLEQVLTYISDYSRTNKTNLLFDSEEQNDLFNSKSIKVGTVDYRKLDIPEKNGYAYVCGYIMKKCLEKHVCQVCIDYANHQKALDQSFLSAFSKSYSTNDSSNFDKLLMPQDDFYNYIIKLDDFFIDNFPSIATNNNIGSTMKDLLCNVRFRHPCQLFNKKFVLDLFIRLRIFTTVRFLNKSMLSESNRKNRKLSILKHL